MRLKGKVTIVTGGSTGIGAVYCRGFPDKGAKIAIADINLQPAKAALEDYKKKGVEVLAVKTDVANADSGQNMARRCPDFRDTYS